MEEIISRLHKGLDIDQIAEELKTSAKVLTQKLNNTYQLPKLGFSVGIEIEGYSTLGYSKLLQTLVKEGIDISYRDWQSNSLVGITNWTLTTDGSVIGFKGQGEDKGMEIVSPPLYTENQIKELDTILSTLRDPRKMMGMHNIFRTNKSCGIHIHFGVVGRNQRFLANVYYLYKLLEPFLDRMLPYTREFNKVHCKSIENLPFSDAFQNHTQKYWSIKVKKGSPTIEFRRHQGSTDFNKIYNWILILQQVLIQAEKMRGVSKLEELATFDYFYKVIENPLLIAYYNKRKNYFDNKKKEKLERDYFDNRVNRTLKLLSEEIPF